MIRRAFFITSTLVALASVNAQVEHGPASPGIGVGIIARHDAAVDFKDGVEVATIDGKDREVQDFSVCFLLKLGDLPQEDHPIEFLVLEQPNNRLVFTVGSGGRLGCRHKETQWFGQLKMPAVNRSMHVGLSVKRDPRQSLAGLWIDGVEQSSFVVAPGNLQIKSPALICRAPRLHGMISAIRIYDRALTRPEIFELSLLANPKPALTGFSGTFALTQNEIIAVLGGSEAVALMEDGGWEAHLITGASDADHRFELAHNVTVRSLAWETDTVFRQDRPLNFGTLSQQLDRVGATTVALMFGRQECLERGADGVVTFEKALDEMLALCKSRTPRLILFGPAPFEKKEAPMRDLSPLNGALVDYNRVIYLAAAKQGAVFVDALKAWPKDSVGFTSDGLTLSTSGVTTLAERYAMPLRSAYRIPAPDIAARLRDTVRAKNKLWHEYWRPSNWAFLHGDRTAQPSSRDHLNPNVRWFPQELEKYRELITTKENEIWKQVSEMGRKLP